MLTTVPRAIKRLRLTAARPRACLKCRRDFHIAAQQRIQQQQQNTQSTTTGQQDDRTTHFGFETVAEAAKQSKGELPLPSGNTQHTCDGG